MQYRGSTEGLGFVGKSVFFEGGEGGIVAVLTKVFAAHARRATFAQHSGRAKFLTSFAKIDGGEQRCF